METDYIYSVILISVLILEIFFIAGVLISAKPGSRLESGDDLITRFLENRRQLIKKAGFKINPEAYISAVLCVLLLFGVLAYLISHNVIISIFALAVSFLLPEQLLRFISKQRSKSFEERYARSLKQLASSLNAGRSIIQSVEDVAECKYVNENLRKEYLYMSNSLKLGIPVTQAFRNFSGNVSSNDAADVALAIEVQNEIGGHEAETILEIANNIQDRILLRKEIKTIFSSTASMIKIMNVVVPACMLVFALTNTSYMEIYFSSPVLIIVFFLLLGLPLLGMYLTNRTMKGIQPKE